MNELALIDEAPAALSWEDKIAWLAAKIAVSPGALIEDDDFDIKHMFKGEWYIREINLPADYIFIGRAHLLGHLVKLIEGSALLVTSLGTVRHNAPSMIHTVPGFQTVAFTLSPVIAQSWHFNPDGCRDIRELEKEHFGEPSVVLERGQQLIKEQLTWQAQ